MNANATRVVDFDTIPDAVADLARGRPIIVVDNEDRENEGDLVVAAEYADADMINFMAAAARGLICVPMPAEYLDRLGIPMMVTDTDDRAHASPFTVSVEAARGVSTGISAGDRARTISVLSGLESVRGDIVMPGHIFPLRAHPDGVRGRRGHTEASVELVRLAGLNPVAVICEIMNDDGTMARRHDLASFARKYDLRMVTISELESYLGSDHATAPANDVPAEDGLPNATAGNSGRSGYLGNSGRSGRDVIRRSRLTEPAALPTQFGDFMVYAYVDEHGLEHVALMRGDVSTHATPLVRVHSECLTGDAFGSVRCDCGDQLSAAMRLMAEADSGLLLYLRQEGRGIGLANKVRAYALQDRGYDTVEANQCLGFAPDERDYSVAVSILHEFGVEQVRLLTNNPAKLTSLEAGGVVVLERIPLTVSRDENSRYMQTKAEKLRHIL